MTNQPHSLEDKVRKFSTLKPGTIISIAVEKGGAGKTASAVNIAAGLARWGALCGWRVLLVDIDPQGTAANAVGQFSSAHHDKNLAMLLDDDHKRLRPHEFIIPSPWNLGHLHYIPSHLHEIDGLRERLITKIGRERRLARILNPLRPDYQFIIVDTGPTNDVLTQNALVASDYVLIPVNLDFLGLEAITRTLRMIKTVQIGLEQDSPKVLGLLGTFYRKNVLSSEEALSLLQKKFKHSLFGTVVPLNSAVPDSFSAGVDLYAYNKYSPAARAYSQIAQELLDRVHNLQSS